jgi:hypothetical protein
VYLGADRLPCRLLAYHLPEEVVEQRRRQAYETARKKGRTPTHAYLHWLQYGWYITNVDATVWAATVVATVYRIRWQIELMFKQWKSLLQLHVLKGTRPERIRCLLYGRLITITMVMRVCSYAAWYASVVCRREVSFPKLLLWLKRTLCPRRPGRHDGDVVCGPAAGHGASAVQTETETTNQLSIVGRPRA